ncbi:MAG: 2Fe-2S iron-sulfur cluster binding domain-containing protein [Alphaproteobacteria bacterium]|nr:2Fe-2S iron-sulfur cluster binding domain-containing protein [Rickettsiales bacterium]
MCVKVNINFVESDGNNITVSTEVDKKIIDIIQENGINLDCLCSGALACSTCHVIVDKESFDKLPALTEEEEDMLDLAHGVKATSRLSCQLVVTKELDGMTLTIPKKH